MCLCESVRFAISKWEKKEESQNFPVFVWKCAFSDHQMKKRGKSNLMKNAIIANVFKKKNVQ